ncbi:MAG: MBL fold metallo-hydrolase [Candidatus Micrarchaeota archaeon]|nr:MBL fold metallo-hydrolase [Candidatus Micrarchaeota archaeon]
MVDILFLGTGGGRVNLIRQLRGTGGFLLLGQRLTIHVDPGPGALVRLHDARQDPAKTDAIVVTHMHVDHVSDAGVLTEAMTHFALQKGGCLIASKSVLQGDQYGDKSVSTYHQSKLEQCLVLRPGDEKKITIAHPARKSHQEAESAHSRRGPNAPASFTIRAIPTRHDDPDGFGFVLEMDGLKIGYTSDTEYIPKVHNLAYAGVDALIANNLKRANDGLAGHLQSDHLVTLLKAAKPKLCILTHMGMGILQSGPEAEAAAIAKASGVPTFAARDGYYYCTDRCGWFKPNRGGGSAPSSVSGSSGSSPVKGQKKLV